jgi:hypothetical protein
MLLLNVMAVLVYLFLLLKSVLKKIKKILFLFLFQINIFLIFSDYFNILISKIIFKK